MQSYHFGNYLFTLRTEKGLSTDQLGKAVGVSAEEIGLWESGNATPSAPQMLPLAQALGVTVEELCRASTDTVLPKSKLRRFLDALAQKSKIFTIVCLILAIVPYLIFVIFSQSADRNALAIVTPITCIIGYVFFRLAFFVQKKNPSISAKTLDFFFIFFLSVMILFYGMMLSTVLPDFLNNYAFALSMIPMMVLSIIHAMKNRKP